MYFDKSIDNIIEDNMMDFSQYVIKNRALPCLYSGMKPIHLKILWTMFEDNITKFTKSETVSGKVMVYSPHGSCYETIVHMAQTDRHIHPLIIGQGNFGSYCSSELMYASGRYTECKLSDIALDSLEGINKHMVEMIDNYDNTRKMPRYLPTKFPLILCMAHNGIAVGMASNTPSFNLNEVCDATIDVINGATSTNLIPDFATGGRILYDDMTKINKEGIGKVVLEAKYKIENNTIIISEIPYGSKISVEVIINKIIELVKCGKLKEITDVLNQNGKDGLSIEIECKRGTDIPKLMNKLYALTPLRSNFNCNMNVLVGKNPKTLGVYDIIQEWLAFRRNCVINGLKYDIEIKSSKLHNLKGLEKVLLDIDKCISIIRKSDEDEIITNLIHEFSIDELQANNIANMKLRNINKNYITKQIRDISNLEDTINEMKTTINDNSKINNLIISQLEEVKRKYGKPRKTEIIYEDTLQEISSDELIEDYLVTMVYTKENYTKKTKKYSEQQTVKDGDEILTITQCSNRDKTMYITDKGNLYFLNIWEMNEKLPSKLGDYLPSILPLDKDETVIGMITTNGYKGYVIIIYNDGHVAKIPLESYKTKTNRTKLSNCLSDCGKPILITQIEENCDLELTNSFNKTIKINTKDINEKKSRSSNGITAMSSKRKGFKLIDVKLIK